MIEVIQLFDDRLFWAWRRDNPRLAQGVSEDAFKDIVRVAAVLAVEEAADRLRGWAEEIGQ